MKKMRVVLVVVLAILALVMVLSLSACGGKETAEPASDAGTSAEGELDTGKTYQVACSADFPPYEYYEGDQIVGAEVDIMSAIAEKLGIQVAYNDMSFDSIIPAIQSKKYDIGMSGFTVTDERKMIVNFTDSYTTACQAILVPVDSPITTADDLFDNVGSYKIGVQLATTGDIYALDDFGADNVEEYEKYGDAVLALTSGKIDCMIVDDAVAKAFAKSTEGLQVLDTAYVIEDYAMALNKDDEVLLAKMNEAIAELMADGTIQGIIDQYITE